MSINKAIFRAYDIRGSSLTDISPSISYKIGYCFTKMHTNNIQNKILVGRDGRLSSPSIYEALIKGLNDGGAKVTSLGIIPSPVLYFADKILSPIASIMITGSHNPKDDNGFKMLSYGKSFFGEQIQQLLTEILSTDWENKIIADTQPVIEELNLIEEYITRLLEKRSILPNLKVAWDPGNGAGGKITEIIATRIPNNNIVINSEIDGNFPNHHPDPSVIENLKQLQQVVKLQNCDVGIAFDGDGDRIGVITSSGRMISGDELICLFAKDIIATNPGAIIILDVKASQTIFEQIEAYGGRPIICKTGHAFIKNKMLETKALLAGEMSGHIFFADRYYGYDDGIYAAMRLLDLLSRSSKSLDEMLDEIPKTYSTPEIKIPVSDDVKFKIIELVKQQLTKEGVAFNDIDGVRITAPDGWWLLRCSNTGPALIARCESATKQGLEILKSRLNALLASYDLKLN